MKGHRVPSSLVRAVFQEKFRQNLLLKTPYKFKKSYRGTPEPQTTEDAPWAWRHGPSLKYTFFHRDRAGTVLLNPESLNLLPPTAAMRPWSFLIGHIFVTTTLFRAI
jgi:hypothetical protein